MSGDNKSASKGAGSDDSKVLGAIAYFLGFFAILLYLIKKEDKFVKFHSIQSILLNVVWMVVFTVLMIGSMSLTVVTAMMGGIGGLSMLCLPFVGLGVLVIVLFMMWKAFSGEMYKLPFIGDLADKYSG